MNNNKSGYWAIAMIITLTIISTIVMEYFRGTLKENHKYTVGKTVKFIYPRNGTIITYQYHVEGKLYTGELGVKRDYALLERCFIVMFNPDHPWVCKFLIDKEVIDTVVPPSLGWDSIPPNILVDTPRSQHTYKERGAPRK